MSCNYADGLSPYHDKGQLGLAEKFDNSAAIAQKVDTLVKWMSKAKHVVLHTGAGISTSAGIPDFRGPKGVWTLQAKGQKPDLSKDFNEAIPTPTHMAITKLVDSGKAKYVVSQNIDGLHLRSGLPRKYLSELHGNMFIEQCNQCNRQFVRNTAVPSVGQKSLNKACPTIKPNGRACRGRLHDTILDWEHSLPENDLAMADFHSCLADLSIAIGTTMQIVPSGSLPLYTKKAGGKLVIINLQPTKHDAKADLLIHGYADDVVKLVMKQMALKIPKYTLKCDPTRLSLSSDKYFEWTISDAATAQMRKIYEAKCGSKEAKKRLEVIDDEDDVPLSRVKTPSTKEEKAPRKRKAEKYKNESGSDSDLEVVGEVAKRTRGRPRKPATPQLPPPKLTIKKNVTPTKTKYVIVSNQSEKKTKKGVKIVYETESNVCADLEMVCESDDDQPLTFTTNFRRYLHDDKTFKREEKSCADDSIPSSTANDSSQINNDEVKDESSDKNTLEEKEMVSETERIIAAIINELIDAAATLRLSKSIDNGEGKEISEDKISKSEGVEEPKELSLPTDENSEEKETSLDGSNISLPEVPDCLPLASDPPIYEAMEVDSSVEIEAPAPLPNSLENVDDGNNNNADGVNLAEIQPVIEDNEGTPNYPSNEFPPATSNEQTNAADHEASTVTADTTTKASSETTVDELIIENCPQSEMSTNYSEANRALDESSSNSEKVSDVSVSNTNDVVSQLDLLCSNLRE